MAMLRIINGFIHTAVIFINYGELTCSPQLPHNNCMDEDTLSVTLISPNLIIILDIQDLARRKQKYSIV